MKSAAATCILGIGVGWNGGVVEHRSYKAIRLPIRSFLRTLRLRDSMQMCVKGAKVVPFNMGIFDDWEIFCMHSIGCLYSILQSVALRHDMENRDFKGILLIIENLRIHN